MTVRPEEEIIRAHDILTAVVLEEVPASFPDAETAAAAHAALDVLCWVLGHAHNQNFANNLERIAQFVEAQGYRLSRRVN